MKGRDILILARTDARHDHGIDEAIARAAEFARLGADILFVEAPHDEAEMRRVCDELPGSQDGQPGGGRRYAAAFPRRAGGDRLRHRRLSADPAERRHAGDAVRTPDDEGR